MAVNLRASSKPVVPGIWWSRINNRVHPSQVEMRKASADSKSIVRYPSGTEETVQGTAVHFTIIDDADQWGGRHFHSLAESHRRFTH